MKQKVYVYVIIVLLTGAIIVGGFFFHDRSKQISITFEDFSPLISFMREQEMTQLSRFTLSSNRDLFHISIISETVSGDGTTLRSYQINNQRPRLDFEENREYPLGQSLLLSVDMLENVLMLLNFQELMDMAGKSDGYIFSFMGNSFLDEIDNENIVFLQDGILNKRIDALQNDIQYPVFFLAGNLGFLCLVVVE